MHVISHSRKLRTDLRIVSSGRSQIVPVGLTVFASATFCGIGFSLLKLTKIIYYYSVLHVKEMLCHDVPIKVVVAARVTLIEPTFLFGCEIRSWSLRLLQFCVSVINTARNKTLKRNFEMSKSANEQILTKQCSHMSEILRCSCCGNFFSESRCIPVADERCTA